MTRVGIALLVVCALLLAIVAVDGLWFGILDLLGRELMETGCLVVGSMAFGWALAWLVMLASDDWRWP